LKNKERSMMTDPATDPDTKPFPDPRTAPEDHEDATNRGVSSDAPAEGGDDAPGGGDNSPDAA
jgi:hypothetical protein